MTADPAEQGEMLERASESAEAGAQFEQAQALAQRAIERTGQLATVSRWPEEQRSSAPPSSGGTRRTPHSSSSSRAAAEFDDLWPDPSVVALNDMLAVAYVFAANRFADCLVVADRVLDVAEHQDLTETLAQALMTKGAALAGLGRVREGTGVIRAGEDMARDAGLTAIQIRGILSRTYWELESDTVRALEGMREGLAIAQRVGDRRLLLRLANNVGFSEFLVGQWDDGPGNPRAPSTWKIWTGATESH